MSGYQNNQRNNATMGRAPFPAHNRQIPNNIRANGTNGIFCYGCQQTKPRLAFSETQLKKAGGSGAKKHHPMCKSCKGWWWNPPFFFVAFAFVVPLVCAFKNGKGPFALIDQNQPLAKYETATYHICFGLGFISCHRYSFPSNYTEVFALLQNPAYGAVFKGTIHLA